MSTPNTPPVVDQGDSAITPISAEPPVGTQEQATHCTVQEVTVEITDIKASGLPAKVGFFTGLFYVRVKGGKVPQRTKTAKYNKGDEFVASWSDTVTLSGFESSKVEIEVYARRFFFSYKIIKKTESKESLADLLAHSETPIELELLEEGQAAGKLVFKISKSAGGGSDAKGPPAPPAPEDPEPPVSTPANQE